MSEYLEANLQVIVRRWPHVWEALQQASGDSITDVQLVEGYDSTLLLNGIQLTSRHNRQHEAQLLADHLHPANGHAILYGTGLGDVQNLLLQRKDIQRITVNILNEDIFLLVLQLLDQRSWLDDQRVTLQLAAIQQEIMIPFAVYPSELVLASATNYRIRDRLINELDTVYVNQRFVEPERQQQYQQRISDNHTFFSVDTDVAKLFDTLAPAQEVCILAPGPSLERHFQQLSSLRQQPQRPLFIALDTAFQPLIAQQIIPDIVVSMDFAISERHFPQPWLTRDVKLVYFPVTNPKVLQLWAGERYLATASNAIFTTLPSHFNPARLYLNGSVIHPALDLAVKMGSEKVTLFGADFSFPHNKTHSGWQDGEIGSTYQQANEWTIDGYGRKVPTLRSFRSFQIGTERFIAKHPHIRFFNTSRSGAVLAGTQYHPELTC